MIFDNPMIIYLLNTYYVTSTMLGTGYREVNKMDMISDVTGL